MATNFDFERGKNWKGMPCSTLNLDHRGNAHEYDTVGTWEFYAHERDHEHQAKLASMGDEVAKANRTDMDFYWTANYNVSETVCEGIADGYGSSLHECELAFIELWPMIRRYKTCTGAARYGTNLNGYVSETRND